MEFMLCKSTNEKDSKEFDTDVWKANYKYDGERIIAVIDNGNVLLVNRRLNLKNKQFQEIVEELEGMPDCILDGEIISKDNNFNKLQSRAGTKDALKLFQKETETPIDYMVFDIISLNGIDLKNNALKNRVEILNNLMKERQFEHIKVCEYGEIEDMLLIAKEKQMEGIIIKNMNSRYDEKRSNNWLKLKLWKEDTINVNKYTLNNAGIRVENSDGIAVQVAGTQSVPLKKMLDEGKEVSIYIQYLEKTKENKYRFPSYRGLANSE
jgi:ATP-dependent DNA ligase